VCYYEIGREKIDYERKKREIKEREKRNPSDQVQWRKKFLKEHQSLPRFIKYERWRTDENDDSTLGEKVIGGTLNRRRRLNDFNRRWRWRWRERKPKSKIVSRVAVRIRSESVRGFPFIYTGFYFILTEGFYFYLN